MEPNDRTPTGEESSRRGRPPVRLAPKPALGATARLGGEVAAARAPGRVLRAATRLSPPRPGAPSAPAPEQEIARSRGRAPRPDPGARGLGHAGRDGGLARGLDLRGRRPKGDHDVGGGDRAGARCEARAREAAAQPRRADRRGPRVRHAGADAAVRRRRPRGGRADPAPDPRRRRRGARDARRGAQAHLPQPGRVGALGAGPRLADPARAAAFDHAQRVEAGSRARGSRRRPAVRR